VKAARTAHCGGARQKPSSGGEKAVTGPILELKNGPLLNVAENDSFAAEKSHRELRD
jgi:hypothetical protein